MSMEAGGAIEGLSMNVHYHLGESNVIVDSLSRIIIVCIAHIENEKELVKDIHRLGRLGVWLIDSSSGGVLVHRSSKSSLVVEVKMG